MKYRYFKIYNHHREVTQIYRLNKTAWWLYQDGTWTSIWDSPKCVCDYWRDCELTEEEAFLEMM